MASTSFPSALHASTVTVSRSRAILPDELRSIPWIGTLTEEEFQKGTALIAKMGQMTNATHNEVVLMAGSLGCSALVCLLNNGNNGQTETTANLLGPFWRLNSPATQNGGTIIRSPTPGPAIFVNCWVKDRNGNPIAGAEVDVWHSSPEGFYEQQDPKQADMNLRGKFTTDAQGKFWFRDRKSVV